MFWTRDWVTMAPSLSTWKVARHAHNRLYIRWQLQIRPAAIMLGSTLTNSSVRVLGTRTDSSRWDGISSDTKYFSVWILTLLAYFYQDLESLSRRYLAVTERHMVTVPVRLFIRKLTANCVYDSSLHILCPWNKERQIRSVVKSGGTPTSNGSIFYRLSELLHWWSVTSWSMLKQRDRDVAIGFPVLGFVCVRSSVTCWCQWSYYH